MNDRELESLQAVHRAVREELGVRLFTILAFRDNGSTMERVYSSHPAEYPVGGRKDVARDVAPDWLAACLTYQVPFFGRTRADVERIFQDAQLIASLGCGSIINVPVVDGARTVAALNILDAEGAYTDEDVATAVDIARRGRSAILAALQEEAHG